ncbi:hypothetical protein AB5I41_28240 [Sphingomonas sp. MMS24-JH45]
MRWGGGALTSGLPRATSPACPWAERDLASEPDLAVALVEGDVATASRALAAREGAIVSLDAADAAALAGAEGARLLDWLCEEVSVSVNTTAAGECEFDGGLVSILPVTGRGTAAERWWRGRAAGGAYVEAPLHQPAAGPPPRFGRIVIAAAPPPWRSSAARLPSPSAVSAAA